jgi:hypothetical protein
LKEEIFKDCWEHQQESNGKKPYWNELFEKYQEFGYRTKEQLRSSFKREKKRRVQSGEIPDDRFSEKTSYEEGDNFINIVCASRRMLSKEDVLNEFNVDADIWEVERFRIKTSEGYRKDRQVEWSVVDGRVVHGEVNDTGKMLVVPLYHVEVRLIRKQNQFTPKTIDKFFESIEKKDFNAKRILPKQYSPSGLFPIIPIADLHFGLVATKEVEGEEYNVAIAEKYYYDIIAQSIDEIKDKDIKEIVFIIGNDFINSDNLQNTTTKGTPQDSEYSWFHLVDRAIEMLIVGINQLREVSNVRVIHVPSNHDRHTMYSIVKVVEQYFRNIDNVIIDNRPIYTKYIMVGQTIFGLTHDIPVKRALEVITTEAKELWSRANGAVWLLAHLHQAMQYQRIGVLEMYRLPAISGKSRWSSERHYVQADKRSQLFIVDEKNGITDVINIFVK